MVADERGICDNCVFLTALLFFSPFVFFFLIKLRTARDSHFIETQHIRRNICGYRQVIIFL